VLSLRPVVLLGELLVPQEFRVHPFGRYKLRPLGFLDAVAVCLVCGVVRARVLLLRNGEEEKRHDKNNGEKERGDTTTRLRGDVSISCFFRPTSSVQRRRLLTRGTISSISKTFVFNQLALTMVTGASDNQGDTIRPQADRLLVLFLLLEGSS